MIGLPLLAFSSCEYLEYRHYQDLVPRGLSTAGIEYRATESWGVGLPGDNETGLVVYELDPDQARELVKGGIRAVALLGRQDDGPWELDDPRRKGLYREWTETPARDDPNGYWGTRSFEGDKTGRSIRIREFLDRYGFGIPIPASIEREIDQALASRGSYFSFGPGGRVFIIMPARKKAALAYAG